MIIYYGNKRLGAGLLYCVDNDVCNSSGLPNKSLCIAHPICVDSDWLKASRKMYSNLIRIQFRNHFNCKIKAPQTFFNMFNNNEIDFAFWSGLVVIIAARLAYLLLY